MRPSGGALRGQGLPPRRAPAPAPAQKRASPLSPHPPKPPEPPFSPRTQIGIALSPGGLGWTGGHYPRAENCFFLPVDFSSSGLGSGGAGAFAPCSSPGNGAQLFSARCAPNNCTPFPQNVQLFSARCAPNNCTQRATALAFHSFHVSRPSPTTTPKFHTKKVRLLTQSNLFCAVKKMFVRVQNPLFTGFYTILICSPIVGLTNVCLYGKLTDISEQVKRGREDYIYFNN